MRVALSVWEIFVALASGAAVLDMLASALGLGGVVWNVQSFFYVGALSAVPVLLLVGATLTLTRTARKVASLLMIAGSGILTAWGLYMTVDLPAEWSRGTADTTDIVITATVLVVGVCSVIAAYKLYTLSRAT